MSALKELKNRLNAVMATRQLTSAMKTVSSIKYSRINNLAGSYGDYADYCGEMVKNIGLNETGENNTTLKKLYVLMSGNRGLCGGYNIELFSFFDEIAKSTENSLFIAVGKKAAEHCAAKNISLLSVVEIPDIPQFENAASLGNTLRKLYENGEVCEIYFVYQKHINLLKRQPQTVKFLPVESGENSAEGKDIIFVPDRKTVEEKIYPFYLNNTVYSALLNSAAGVQAATLTAMRSAFDTASEAAAALNTSINRRRQAEVTASVIETASDNFDTKSEVH